MAKRNAYIRAVAEVYADTSPARPTTRTASEIESDIRQISEELKRPVGDYERVCLLEDRQRMRKQLAALQEQVT